MARPLAKSPFVLLALALWILACAASLAEDDDPKALNQQVKQLIEQAKYQEAIPIAEKAVEVAKRVRGPEHPETADALNNLGLLFKKTGDYAKAEPLYQEAVRIRQKVLGSENPGTATSLNNLAGLYLDMGEYAKAEALLQEALRIWQKALGPERLDTATGLNNLALLYWIMGEYAKAEPLDLEALRIFQKVLGPANPYTATSLNSLAELYQDMGEYSKAEPLLQEALRIRQKVLGSEHPDTATSLDNLAELYRVFGEYAKAEPLYQEGLRIRQKVFGPENPDTTISLNNLALLYQNMGEYAKAEPLYQEALRIRQKVFGQNMPIRRASIPGLFVPSDTVRQSRTPLPGSVPAKGSCQNYTPRLDNLAFCESLAGLTRLRSCPPGLLFQPAQKLSAETNQRIEALEAEVEKIESELAQHVAGLGQARHALGVSLQQVQLTIPNDGALIEYLRYGHYLGKGKWEWRYGAIVLFSKGAPLWIPLGKAKDVEQLVRRYGRLVRGSPEEEELSANLQALYEALWEPIGQVLPSQTKRTIISPDGELNFISFATLLTKDKQFLAQTYEVQYVASGRDLLRELKPSTAKEVVLFANPDFGLTPTPMLAKADNGSSYPASKSIRGSEKRDVEDWSFESLDGTQKESDELIKKFAGWGWTPSDFTAKGATKEALLKIHSPYILHLATHGFFAKKDPTTAQTEPGAQLGGRQSVTQSKFFKNPMHRTGLALAGAQTTIEAWKRDEVPPVENDGILTAEDVSTLDLQGTWLVTLSACDTGSGEARAGEGVLGLRRGFIQAGAQNLLMTLWPISDEVTVQMMSDFYDAAHQTGNAPQALAEVQREWLVQLRDGEGPKFDAVKDAIKGRGGLAKAVNLAGPFIMSSQGKP